MSCPPPYLQGVTETRHTDGICKNSIKFSFKSQIARKNKYKKTYIYEDFQLSVKISSQYQHIMRKNFTTVLVISTSQLKNLPEAKLIETI